MRALMASHEAAYLDHCRRHAMDQAAEFHPINALTLRAADLSAPKRG
jgi:hypothetical protein